MNKPNKTIKDLIAENQGWSAEEFKRAIEYERSLLGSDFQYPCNGEVYQALDDVEINYLTHWAAPYTGGEAFVFKKGESIIVEVSDHNPKPISVHAKAVDEARLETEIIPEKDRLNEKYGGYSLSVDCNKLKTHFRLVD